MAISFLLEVLLFTVILDKQKAAKKYSAINDRNNTVSFAVYFRNLLLIDINTETPARVTHKY